MVLAPMAIAQEAVVTNPVRSRRQHVQEKVPSLSPTRLRGSPDLWELSDCPPVSELVVVGGRVTRSIAVSQDGVLVVR
jgi:hypothetical protein